MRKWGEASLQLAVHSSQFVGQLCRRLQRTSLRSAFEGREVEQGLKAQLNLMCSLAGPTEVVALLQSSYAAFFSEL
jgi:hypothetical protein